MDQQKALVDPQQWNRYAYVRNNPLRYIDPDGRAIETLWDLANIAWSAKTVWDNPRSASDWGALALDVGATALPGVPAMGATLRVVGRIDDVADGARTLRALPAISASTIETALTTGTEAAGRQGTRRAAEHAATKGIEITSLKGLESLARGNARAVEQTLIEIHKLSKEGGTLMNRINSIAKTNETYADALRRGSDLLNQAGYVIK